MSCNAAPLTTGVDDVVVVVGNGWDEVDMRRLGCSVVVDTAAAATAGWVDPQMDPDVPLEPPPHVPEPQVDPLVAACGVLVLPADTALAVVELPHPPPLLLPQVVVDCGTVAE